MTKKITLDSRELEELTDSSALISSISHLIEAMNNCGEFTSPELQEALLKIREGAWDAVEPLLAMAESFNSRFTEEEGTDD